MPLAKAFEATTATSFCTAAVARMDGFPGQLKEWRRQAKCAPESLPLGLRPRAGCERELFATESEVFTEYLRRAGEANMLALTLQVSGIRHGDGRSAAVGHIAVAFVRRDSDEVTFISSRSQPSECS